MRLLRSGAVLGILAVASVISVQAQSRIIIGAGSTIGLEELAESPLGATDGPSAMLGYEYVSRSGFGVRIDGMYHSLSADDQLVDDVVTSVRFRAVTVTANLLYRFSTASGVRPYLLGGVGHYSLKTVYSPEFRTDETTAFGVGNYFKNLGVNVGGGIETRGRAVQFFGEARLHHILAKREGTLAQPFNLSLMPITVGAKIPFGGR